MEHCEEYLELISAAIDGQISPQARQTLNQHLAQCPGCRALYAAMAEDRAALSAVGESEPPEGFARAVMERVKAEPRTKVIPLFRRPRVKKLLTTAACALLCVGVVRFAAGSIGMGSAAPTSGNSTGAAAPASSCDPSSDAAAHKQEGADYGDNSTALYAASAHGSGEQTDGEKAVRSAGGTKMDPGKQASAPDGRTDETGLPNGGIDPAGGDTPSFAGTSAAVELPLTNTARYRVTWGEGLAAGAYLLRSRAELDDLLTQLDTEGLTDRFARYDQAWFDGDRQLVAVVVTESSGSVYHQITGLTLRGEQVEITVLRRLPEEGTCDMAAWLLTAETAGAEDLPLTLDWYSEEN